MFIHPSNHCIYCSIGRKTTCHGERPCASWPSLASRLLPPRHKCGSWQAHIQASQKKLFRVRNDKSRVASVQTSCHRERSVAIYSQGDYHAVHSARLVMTRTTDAFHRNDKVLGQGTCLQSDMTEHLQQLFRSIGNHYQHRKLHCHLFEESIYQKFKSSLQSNSPLTTHSSCTQYVFSNLVLILKQ